MAGSSSDYAYDYRISYATFFCGEEYEEAREIILLPDGSVIFGGQTSSPDMPVTSGAFQEKYHGEPVSRGHYGEYGGDLFIARLPQQNCSV